MPDELFISCLMPALLTHLASPPCSHLARLTVACAGRSCGETRPVREGDRNGGMVMKRKPSAISNRKVIENNEAYL